MLFRSVPDRGPVKTLVDGWDIVHTGGTFEQPNQTDVFTVTPKAGYEDVKYIATVVKKENTPSVEDFAFTTFAMETREEILAKVASGELPNFDAGLSTGTTTLTAENMVGDVYVVVVAFGDNQFYTGEYQFTEIAVPDITPAYYKWLGEYPDLNKAVCEATDLQWKYAYDIVRKRKKRGYNRKLNRPSENYQSPNNLPFTMPSVDSGKSVDEIYEEWWRTESVRNAY